jgi:hypothetical protein
MLSNPHTWRASAIIAAFLLLSGGVLALKYEPLVAGSVEGTDAAAEVEKSPEAKASASPKAKASSLPNAAAASPPPPRRRPVRCERPGVNGLEAPIVAPTSDAPYRGLGAWVDVFDYCIGGDLDPRSTVDELARRGVKTLFLQTGRFRETNDIADVATIMAFLDRAAAHGIAVVGWYVPGFGDVDRDLRRSLAVLRFVTPSGNRFAGFAPDIESRDEVGPRFNQGIVEYSQRLRAAVPPGTVLGAIVVDAKNNTRAQAAWGGFPWAQIGHNYDVILPMAYWTVVRGYALPACLKPGLSADAYMEEVVARTTSRMGRERPIHLIGGIADCIRPEEMTAYVTGSLKLGTIGGSLYDFVTLEGHPQKELLWGQLARFNR